MHLIRSPRLPTDILCAPYTPASRLEVPLPEGMIQHPIMLDSDPNPNPNVICYDSACLPLSSGAHQGHTHHCLGFQVTVPEGHTPFMKWLWLVYEEFMMSMRLPIENGILTIHSTTCKDDGEPC